MKWVILILCPLVVFYLLFRYLYRRRVMRFAREFLNALQGGDALSAENLPAKFFTVNAEDSGKPFSYIGSDPMFSKAYEELALIIGQQRKHETEKQELLEIINAIAGNMEFEKMLEELMPRILGMTKSNCGAFYLINQASNKLQIKFSVGFSKNLFSEFDISLGEGFFGADFVSRKVQVFNDMPEDTLYVIRTFLGKIKPKSVMVVPVITQDTLTGALVLSSIYNYTEESTKLIEQMKYHIGVAVGNGIAYEKTKRLTNELKFQNKLIQNLNEDLETKVSERIIFLNSIIDSIQDYAIYAMDKNGIILAWNKGAEYLLGYSADEVMGKNVETVYTEEEIKSGRVKKRIETVLREGKYAEVGWRTRKDGTRCYVDIMIAGMYDQKGEIIGMTNVTCDITRQRILEDALTVEKEFAQRVLESNVNAILLTDDRGIIQIANSEAEAILGTGQLLGRGLFEFFENSQELRGILTDLAGIASRGQWEYKTREEFKTVKINAEVLSGELDTRKIFINLYE